MSEPIVHVNEGKLKGNVATTVKDVQYYSFKGIPYAKPPVGELRFAIPQPPESWKGVRDATKDCNICAQVDKLTGNVVGDEDCLYLNVYTPKLPTSSSELLPVMFFIHGGGFIFGNGTDTAKHGPDFLIEKDVVIVSFNFRIGILGFLALGCKDAPGNMGLRDQVMALKWVQRNISKFGGDPNNVTIFGISAGGSSVEYLLLSPLSRGLFHKAIAQSGSSLVHWAQNDKDKIKTLAARIPTVKGKVITDSEELLKYFKDLPTNELIKLSFKAIQTDEFRGGIHFGFVPTVEESGDWEPFLGESSYQLLAKGEFAKVPFMTGLSEREGLLMVLLGPQVLDKLAKEKKFIDYFPFVLDPVEETELESRLKSIYLEGEQTSKDVDGFAINYFTDVDFLGGIYTAATLIAKHNSPVYLYEFCYDGALNYLKKLNQIDRVGAAHADEGGYILRCEALKDALSDTDKRVQEVLLTLWTNFARYGNPTPKTDNLITTNWEPIAETGAACLVIDKDLSMKYELYPERMKLFLEMYEKKIGCK